MIRLAAIGALLAASLVSAGCDVNEYCINCATGDGGVGDGGGGGDGSLTPDAPIIDANPNAGDACVPSGVEVCDGLDNDCDMSVDEGDLDGVGVTCGTNEGECVAGTTECTSGMIVCAGAHVPPVPEVCDNLDNDCDGNADNGDPEGGGACGTNQGECVAGINRCIDGAIECVGEVEAAPAELCNSRDDDCDGNFDEGVPPGASCGPAEGNTGECMLGTEMCIGGVMQCVGAMHPTLEQCDSVDHDCDGDDTNGFDLDNDARNCGACGNDCTDDFMPSDHVSAVRCSVGTCEIAACEDDYFNTDGIYSTGCNFFCDTFVGPQEACNDSDDDCDGDVDEDLIAPEACDENGMNCRDVCDLQGTVCAGGASMCTNGGWECTGWPGYVETDGNGNLVSETLCDGLDNDCDGLVDESYPLKDEDCFDSGVGICRRQGTWACNSTNDGLECANLSPVVNPGTEVCNGLDDDCMGDVDEGFTDGTAQPWVDIGSGVEILPYEASRPDADDQTAGALETHVCSEPDRLPWTGLTHPEAEAACASIGARLCTEAEWQRACTRSFPQAGGADDLIVIETEDYQFTNAVTLSGVLFRWIPVDFDNPSGGLVMYLWPNTHVGLITDTSGPRMDYYIDFDQAGTHYVWVRGNDWQGGNADDTFHVAIDGSIVATMGRLADGWSWENDSTGGSRVTINIPSPDTYRFSIYMHDEAVLVDKIVITTNPGYTPSGSGPAASSVCTWAYGSSCNSYQPDSCNGNDYDTDGDPMNGDQDGTLATGSLAACYADWGGAGRLYDMSGNVREWTAERGPGENPFRGGASNSPAGGIECTSSFGVADDSFAFPNLGFRCCR